MSKYLKVSDAFTAENYEYLVRNNLWRKRELYGPFTFNERMVQLFNKNWQKTSFFKSWYLKGIEQITHLMKDRDTFLSFRDSVANLAWGDTSEVYCKYDFTQRFNLCDSWKCL